MKNLGKFQHFFTFSLQKIELYGNMHIARWGYGNFGKNQTPDLLFHYIYGNKFNECIEYVNANGSFKNDLETIIKDEIKSEICEQYNVKST